MHNSRDGTIDLLLCISLVFWPPPQNEIDIAKSQTLKLLKVFMLLELERNVISRFNAIFYFYYVHHIAFKRVLYCKERQWFMVSFQFCEI